MSFAQLGCLRCWKVAWFVVPALIVSPLLAAKAKPTPIADVKHDGPVDFEKAKLPLA